VVPASSFNDGQPIGAPRTSLDGFVDDKSEAPGLPVEGTIDAHSGILVADDVGNVIWRVSVVKGNRNL
jgi:hypothetical protein